MTLIGFITKTVSAREYYADVFEDRGANTERWPTDGEVRVLCCFHPESNPSLYCNLSTGQWYCHGCGVGGKSIVSFDSLYNRCSHDDSAEALFHHYVHPVIPHATVEAWARALRNTPSFLRYLRDERLLSPEVVARYSLGMVGERLAIPIYNEFGLCVNAKLYDPRENRGKMPKMLSYEVAGEDRSFGSPPMLYPLSAMSLAKSHGAVIVCEGEWDALALLSIGVPAVTGTGGCKAWPEQYDQLFRGLDVGIAYDNDPDGKTYAAKPAKSIAAIAKSVRRIEVPELKYRWRDKICHTKDVTDWLRAEKKSRAADFWREQLDEAKVLTENVVLPETSGSGDEPEVVTLDQATSPNYARRTVGIDCLVSGKGVAPYHLTRRFRASCAKTCDKCPLLETDRDFEEVTIEKNDPFLLELCDAQKPTVRRLLLNKARISASAECYGQVEELETVSVEQLLLIPTLDSGAREYVTRSGYYVGHGIRTNSGYRLTGSTVPHPRDQHATHLFTTAKPLKDEIETFSLTPDLKQRLTAFRPNGRSITSHLKDIADWQSRTVTKIRQRPDLHIGVDLVFHSVRAFSFNGEYIRRGMLDVLVIGDTRCGKGQVSEGLVRYYGLGEVASGENCTFAGLVGGVQQIGGRWFVTWGLIPLNNGRMVVIDEASALSTKEFGQMSRVRSEGVAEISKIVRETTQANTRLLWLANPRSGSPIGSYNAGIEAIKELVGANEDISRYDFALTVATDEVASEVINAEAETGGSDDRYSAELCRSLILWAWSRKPEEVIFSPEATGAVVRAAIELGKTYSPNIPLIQGENIRIKLAKISAAVAARCFSTDETLEKLIVTSRHVRAAIELLEWFYKKPSMGYDRYSHRAHATTTLEDTGRLERILANTGSNQRRLVEGLLTLHRITPSNLADYVGGDVIISRAMISDLVIENCLRLDGERGAAYLKNPAFRDWLKSHQTKLK